MRALLFGMMFLCACAKDRSGERETDTPDGDDEIDVTPDVPDVPDDGDVGPDVDDSADADDADADDADADTDVEPDACVPSCAGRACGDDGCGGTCGACGADEQCSPLGACLAIGCLPRCGDNNCGDDGCGGSCGTCADATPFCDAGRCVPECVPDCGSKACGDDGCGGTCGACGAGLACSTFGACVPSAWACGAATYDANDHCDCDCGAPDPDCERGLALLGCDAFDRCVDGACTPRIPAAWTCDPHAYGDGAYCECTCGAPDPDCADPTRTTLGCDVGERCDDAGACVACAPDCTGRVCGDDGCGGTCGSCPDPAPESGDPQLACVAGQCVDGCAPTPTICLTNACGDDGCGGTCGTCPTDTTCVAGQCAVDAGKSCAGNCGVEAPGGCGCDDACVAAGDCCPDYGALCACVPDCDGRVCGDDGCGGSCGECGTPGLAFCGGNGQCRATCEPLCGDGECGPDGCGGTCGTCGAGEACNAFARCVPADWRCAEHYYGDGGSCDCGCGAPDPDCATIGLTFNCPLGAGCDDASGLCDIAFCANEAQCPGPAACVGRYPSGDGALDGVCQAPDAAAAPPGTPCNADSNCAHGVCAAGICRAHCRVDGDCDFGRVCVGVPTVDALSGRGLGITSVCDGAAVTSQTCARQSACDTACLVVVSPASHEAVYRCGTPSAAHDLGAPCDAAEACALGLVCANEQCVLPCPGGQTDCGPDATCDAVMLHDGATVASGDDVLVNACVPD